MKMFIYIVTVFNFNKENITNYFFLIYIILRTIYIYCIYSGRTPRVCIIFLIIQRLRVNYSTYTTVATLQDIDQMIYFKAFVRFFYFNRE